MNAVTTKFVRTSTNKVKCPVFVIRVRVWWGGGSCTGAGGAGGGASCTFQLLIRFLQWTPEGRRLVTGASSGEFTLWNGLTFNFETILQVNTHLPVAEGCPRSDWGGARGSACSRMEQRLWALVTVTVPLSLQAHDSPVRAMTWSHNDMWMLTADHGGYVKYWQSNMNNVKMFQAHKEAIREARFLPNLPLSVARPTLCCSRSACGGRRLAPGLLLGCITDRCKCVLLQHCAGLLLMLFLLASELFTVNKVIGSEVLWPSLA